MFFFNHKKKNKQEEEKQEEINEQQTESKVKEAAENAEGIQEQTKEQAKETEEDKQQESSADGKEQTKEEAAPGENKERELSGFALFKDKAFDIEAVAKALKQKTGLEAEIQEGAEHPTFMVKTPEGVFVCTHLAVPVPNGEVQSNLQFNAVEKDVVQDIQNHQSFVVIARINEPFKNRIASCITFTKIASVLMMQPNAAAMYIGSMRYILSPIRYAAFLGQIMQEELQDSRFFPMPLWIKVSMFKFDKGIKAITSGLKDFGLYEVGFEETKRPPEEIYKKIMALCDMYLVDKCQFQDGDSMRLDPQTEAVFKLEKDVLYIVEK